MNKILITAAIITGAWLHLQFIPNPPAKFDLLTVEIIREYETKCLVNNILEHNFYTCVDLKKYLLKKGYE